MVGFFGEFDLGGFQEEMVKGGLDTIPLLKGN